MISRREITLTLLGMTTELVSLGQGGGELSTPEGDTWVTLFPSDKGFGVGVRTSVKADQALVEVFYSYHDPRYGKLLLSRSSMAPVAGLGGYGATRDNFQVPRQDIRSIKVTFFNEIDKREVKVG